MTTNRKTDEILIKEFQNGDRNAYTQLVTRYRDKIISFLYRYMHDMDSAEDLAQEAFFKVYLKKDSYKETYKFSFNVLIWAKIYLIWYPFLENFTTEP